MHGTKSQIGNNKENILNMVMAPIMEAVMRLLIINSLSLLASVVNVNVAFYFLRKSKD